MKQTILLFVAILLITPVYPAGQDILLKINGAELTNFLDKNSTRYNDIEIKSSKPLDIKEINDNGKHKILFFSSVVVVNGGDISLVDSILLNDDYSISPETDETKKVIDRARDTFKTRVPEKLYDDGHLLFGNKDAKHKVLLFSDPLCPHCRGVVPVVMSFAKNNPSEMALYYYHKPLVGNGNMSMLIMSVMEMAIKSGKKDLLPLFYSMKIPNKGKDILANLINIHAAVKRDIGFDYDMRAVFPPDIKKKMKIDVNRGIELGIYGTPTFFINGEWDFDRSRIAKMISGK